MKRNFTLLELAVVVTVSTLLLTVLVSSAHAAVEQAKKASCQDVLRKLAEPYSFMPKTMPTLYLALPAPTPRKWWRFLVIT